MCVLWIETPWTWTKSYFGYTYKKRKYAIHTSPHTIENYKSEMNTQAKKMMSVRQTQKY